MPKPHWKVQITGDRETLNSFSEMPNTPTIQIVREVAQFYLLSDQFDPNAPSHEIERKAMPLVDTLNGVARLVRATNTPETIKLPGIQIRLREDGTGELWHMVQPVMMTITMGTLTILPTDAMGNVVEPYRPTDPIAGWVRLGAEPGPIADVLRWWGREEHGWSMLWKVYETIIHDIGPTTKLESLGWATRSELGAFNETACSPAHIGDAARHGVQRNAPRYQPMALRVAQCMIERLILKWLEQSSLSYQIE